MSDEDAPQPSERQGTVIHVEFSGLLLFLSVLAVCFTVWCIFVGMGKVDPALVSAWANGPKRVR